MYGLLGPSDRSGLALQSRFEGIFPIMKSFMLAAAATLMLCGSASAQDSALKPMLNCDPPSNGAPAWNSQAVEKSAILPSGSENAAPTVQRHGLPVEVRNDCPPESSDPDAGKPKG